MTLFGTHAKRWFSLLVALGLLLFGGGLALAQDASPSAGDDLAAGTAHPAHIHTGTCDTLGDVVYPLNDVTLPGRTIATPEDDLSSTPVAVDLVAESTTMVDAPLEDILATEHAINVHLSTDEIGTYIACGDVTGEPVDGLLDIELMELNGSGYMGQATLVDNDGESTTVTVTIMETGATATPEASPAASAQAGLGDATVGIAEFNYTPQTITIPAGGSVTWVNNDAVPHTATAMDREVLQSGTIEPGDDFTQVFDTPGTYEYFCEFHPDMSGTVIVQ
ncbi:MAG: cupredoxin domain-containing protein [Chloroflexota bacterium]|nr:cupredoxin domain-containing protein [Chloroflexota bacterium]